MKNIISLVCMICFLSNALIGQMSWDPFMNSAPENYISCAAIFYNDKMLVDEYSPRGKCEIKNDFSGDITVFTVKLGDKPVEALEPIEFQVAFHNKRTNTMRMYSSKTYFKISLDEILRDSDMGDTIIILTTDKHYSLTHHEIFVPSKC